MGRAAMKWIVVIVASSLVLYSNCQQPAEMCTDSENQTRIVSATSWASYVEVCIMQQWVSLRDEVWDTYGAEYVCTESNFTGNGTSAWASSDFEMPQQRGYCLICVGLRLECHFEECVGYPALVSCNLPLLPLLYNNTPTQCDPTQTILHSSSADQLSHNTTLIQSSPNATTLQATIAATLTSLSSTISPSSTISTPDKLISAADNVSSTTISIPTINASPSISSITNTPPTTDNQIPSSLPPFKSSYTSSPLSSAIFPSMSVVSSCNITTTIATTTTTAITTTTITTTAFSSIVVLMPTSTTAQSAMSSRMLTDTSFILNTSTADVSQIISSLPCTTQSPTHPLNSMTDLLTTTISPMPSSDLLSSSTITASEDRVKGENKCGTMGGFLGAVIVFMAVIIVLMFIGWVWTYRKGKKKASKNFRHSEVYEILDQRTIRSPPSDVQASTCSINHTLCAEDNNYSGSSSPPALYDVIRDKHFFMNTLTRDGDESSQRTEHKNRDSQCTDNIYHVLEHEAGKIPKDCESLSDKEGSDEPQEYEVPLKLMTPDIESNDLNSEK